METTVNTKGQVTIPARLRTKYGFLPGTKVMWIERDGQVIPVRVRSWQELYGSLRPKPGQPSLTEMLLAERQADREREVIPWSPR